MKIDKDKLIDILVDLDIEKYIILKDNVRAIASMIILSINPLPEPDGHRRLEDNKGKKKYCPECAMILSPFEIHNGKCLICNKRFGRAI